jgi:mannonate dehydratase
MAANVHLDVACHNFGVQEWSPRGEAEREMFPGMPQLRGGRAWPNEEPGLGVDFEEGAAAEFPPDDDNPTWTESRLPDGTLWRP